jgi:hypothetical protein
VRTFRRLSLPAQIAVVVIVFALVANVFGAFRNDDGTSGGTTSETRPATTNSVPPRGSATDTTVPTTTLAPTTTLPPAPPSSTGGGSIDPLAGLTVAAERRAGYDRDLFDHWIDADGDGCNTRWEVLITESRTPVSISGSCTVSGGSWVSPFDGVATTNPSDLDIDHLVPLAEAWDSGAHSWSASRRRAFANDLDLDAALIAVTDNLNQQKGDDDPAEWLPPRAAYRCTYARNWIAVKKKWELSIDPVEADALRRVLATC